MYKKIKRVSVHGSYYGQNFGDILLVALYVKWIKSAQPKAEINLPLSCKSNFESIGAHNRGLLNALKSDCLIYTGGGYFGEPKNNILKWTFRNYFRHIVIGKIFQLMNKPVVIVGVGVGPLSNKFIRNSVTSLCKYATVLVVRDVQSKNFLMEYGVEEDKIKITADSALTVTKDDIPDSAYHYSNQLIKNKTKNKIIGLHLSHSKEYSLESKILFNEIIDFFKNFTEIELKLIVDGSSRHNHLLEQEMAAKEVLEALGSQAQIMKYKDHWNLIALLSKLDIVITTKLHVGITSIALEIPVISFPYHSKTQRLFYQLNQSERCMPVENLQRGQAHKQLEYFISNNLKSTVNQSVIDDANINKKIIQKLVRGEKI